MSDSLETIMATAMAALRLPSLSLGVRRRGRADVTRSEGYADLENEVRATPTSVYRIGSLTKMFTGAAVLRLVDSGMLQLESTLGTLIPEYPPHAHGITVHQLLTHTSGIRNYTELPEFAEKSRLDLSHQQLGRMFATLPLEFEPGERYRYSNSGYYLLGGIIEIVSGLPYHEFMQREFFTPLSLRDTYYLDEYRIIPRRVRGYDEWQSMTINAGHLSMTAPFAAGALGSTVEDLLAWGSALLAGDVVSATSQAHMTTPGALNDGVTTTYGYGVVIGDLEGRRKWSHAGTINGFRCQLAMYPEDHAVVVVLANSGIAPVEQIETHVARWALEVPERVIDEIAVAVADLSRVAGRYEFESGPIDVTLQNGELAVAGLRLRPVGPDTYVLDRDVNTRVSFATDGTDGGVIVVDREGQRAEGRRR